MRQRLESPAEVLLISPHGRRDIYLPHALLSIGSYLDQQGVATSILESTDNRLVTPERLSRHNGNFQEAFLSAIQDTVHRHRPRVIGIPCYTSEYHQVMALAKEIKRAADVKIVVGGPHPTLQPDDFLFSGSPVDYAVSGDGEQPLLRIVQALRKNQLPPVGIEGVAYLDGQTGMAVVQGCHVETDLTRFPLTDFSKIDMAYYLRPSRFHLRFLLFSGTQIFTSRGCPYSCEFCAVSYMRDMNRAAAKMRYRDVDHVIEELRLLKMDYGIDCFYVLDDCFMIQKHRTAEFCEKLLAQKLQLVWGAETRANLISEKDSGLLRLMKKAGMVQLDFGVESGSEEMLRRIKKKITVPEIKHAFEVCHEHGIRTYANILFNLPGETERDVRQTQALLDDIRPTVTGAATTVPIFGTAIYKQFINPGLTKAEYDLYNGPVYEQIVDPRFKLSSHDVDVSSIVVNLNKSYYYHPIRLITLRGFYWLALWRSTRKAAYVMEYLRLWIEWPPVNRIIGKLVYYGGAILRRVRRKCLALAQFFKQ